MMMISVPCILFRFLAAAKPKGCSAMSNSLIPPSFRPAGGLMMPGLDGVLAPGVRKPPVGTLLGMPLRGAKICLNL
jgi:hypothetical protein